MKYIYIYSNESKCNIDIINDLEIDRQELNVVYHSKLINNKNMLKECSEHKFVHILEKYKSSYDINYYRYLKTLYLGG